MDNFCMQYVDNDLLAACIELFSGECHMGALQ